MYGTNYLFEEAALIKLLPTECREAQVKEAGTGTKQRREGFQHAPRWVSP